MLNIKLSSSKVSSSRRSGFAEFMTHVSKENDSCGCVMHLNLPFSSKSLRASSLKCDKSTKEMQINSLCVLQSSRHLNPFIFFKWGSFRSAFSVYLPWFYKISITVSLRIGFFTIGAEKSETIPCDMK